MSDIFNLAQARMRYALDEVEKTRASQQVVWKEYKARCNGLGAEIMQNGLHQALLFCAAKRKDAARQALLQQMQDWLLPSAELGHKYGLPTWLHIAGVLDAATLPADDGAPRLLRHLQTQNMQVYMQVTREALALCHVLQRFAQAFADAPDQQAQAAEAAHV